MSLQYIVLGFLRDKPSSGYDLNKYIQDSAFHFWKSEQSQIYRALYKLRDLGWIDYEVVVQEHVPNKKVYEITPKGEAAFQTWLQSSIEDSNPNHTWVAQLYFANEKEPHRIREILQLRINNREDWLNDLKSNTMPEPDTLSKQVQSMTLDYYINLTEAELNWLRAARDEISNQA